MNRSEFTTEIKRRWVEKFQPFTQNSCETSEHPDYSSVKFDRFDASPQPKSAQLEKVVCEVAREYNLDPMVIIFSSHNGHVLVQWRTDAWFLKHRQNPKNPFYAQVLANRRLWKTHRT